MKENLRQKILLDRRTFDEYQYFAENEVIYQKVRQLLEVLEQRRCEAQAVPASKIASATFSTNLLIVGFYWPITGEPDLFKLAIDSGPWRVALPKLVSPLHEINNSSACLSPISVASPAPKSLALANSCEMQMVLYAPASATELMPGVKKIFQPKSNCQVIPDVIIIPALAYSIAGYRLGFGAGHYDRYISRLFNFADKKITLIGVCFDKYLCESLPNDPHDLRVDYLVTEQTTIKICQ